MATLVLKLNGGINEFVLKQGDTTIGRHPDNDIVIENMAVSAQHASIFTAGEDAFIQDLKSTNGTFINKKRIVRHHLAHGDQILIGKQLLLFRSQPAVAAPGTTEAPAPFVRELSSGALAGVVPAMAANSARRGALFILTGPNSGKRVDLVRTTTYLGKTGKPTGVVVQTPQGYRLHPADGADTPQRNAHPVSQDGEDLRNGDIIEVADTRLQFYLK